MHLNSLLNRRWRLSSQNSFTYVNPDTNPIFSFPFGFPSVQFEPMEIFSEGGITSLIERTVKTEDHKENLIDKRKRGRRNHREKKKKKPGQ